MIGNVSSTGMQAWGSQVSGQQHRPPPPDFAKMFSAIDGDGDGAVTETELSALLPSSSGASGDVSALLSSLDADGDGSIAQSEFTSALENVLGQLQGQAMGGMPPPPPPGGEDRFASMDTDGDGSISSTELGSAISARSEATGRSGPSVEDMMARLDSDGDGALSEAELQAGAEARRGPPPPRGEHGGDSSQFIANVLRQYLDTASLGSDSSTSSLIASA